MAFSRIPLLLALIHLASSSQPSAPSPVSQPLRELPWGQLNFLQTTDTHGWHAGHLQEAQYSADWGDYISFAHHLQQRADADGSDLLLVDTGDRVEGNGLYDASDPKGKYTSEIFKQQRVDVITPGNHELYLQNSSLNEYYETVPNFKNAYIASNLDIYNPENGELQPLAPRYRKFTTKNQGIRVLAFGFLFNFKGNANNTHVQEVQKTVKEKWFQDAIRSKDVDLFVVAGHVPVRDTLEYDLVYKSIREVQWDIPIAFFGGHTHIRDYRKWDKKAYGIESGRYMETLGFMSISGLNSNTKEVSPARSSPIYKRLYIDNNLYSLHHHSSTNESTFGTELGQNVSKAISEARSDLNLDHAYGCAPHDYWLNRAPYPAKDSLLTWLETEVLPDTFSDAKKPTIVLTNSGAMRFDIFKGPFTIDSTFLVSPFTSGLRMIKDVPYGAASRVLSLLNNEKKVLRQDLVALSSFTEGELFLGDLSPPQPPVSSQSQHKAHLEPSRLFSPQVPLSDRDLIPGYTTVDDAGEDGDDTLHQQIRFYNVPNCIGSDIGFNATDKPDRVDLVYNGFIENWVLLALRYLGQSYDLGQTESAVDGKTMTTVISEWVGEHWKCED